MAVGTGRWEARALVKKIVYLFSSKTSSEDSTRNSYCLVIELLFHIIKAFNSLIASSVQIMNDMMPQICIRYLLSYIAMHSYVVFGKKQNIWTPANLQALALIRSDWKKPSKSIYFRKLQLPDLFSSSICILEFYFMTKLHINFIQACHLKCGFNTTNLRLIWRIYLPPSCLADFSLKLRGLCE